MIVVIYLTLSRKINQNKLFSQAQPRLALLCMFTDLCKQLVILFELVVECLRACVVAAVRLQILDDVVQEVRTLHLAADVAVQAREVHVEVVELRLVVDEDAELVRRDAVGLADRRGPGLVP